MNKQELIDYCNVLKENKNRFINCIDVNRIIRRIEQLDEPETGHADEAPRYVKNILARLRELPVHDREVWLKAIMGEFERDFSHAKWREGYEQGKLEGAWVGNQLKDADKIRRELNQVKVPQYVADVIEGAREQSVELEDAFEYVWEVAIGELREWFRKLENRNNFARAWLDGYEVEEEPKYIVKIKGVGFMSFLNHDLQSDLWSINNGDNGKLFKTHHTRKELDDADFGWVFDCEGIQIEEVE